MEGLGRCFNVIPIAASRGISLKEATAITFICTGNDTFTLTVADTFAGSYGASTAGLVASKYTNTATNGTAAWVGPTAQAASDAVVIASGTVAFHVSANSLPDGKAYIKCTPSGAGLVVAILHDLSVMRTPANLRILSA